MLRYFLSFFLSGLSHFNSLFFKSNRKCLRHPNDGNRRLVVLYVSRRFFFPFSTISKWKQMNYWLVCMWSNSKEDEKTQIVNDGEVVFRGGLLKALKKLKSFKFERVGGQDSKMYCVSRRELPDWKIAPEVFSSEFLDQTDKWLSPWV